MVSFRLTLVHATIRFGARPSSARGPARIGQAAPGKTSVRSGEMRIVLLKRW